MDVERDGPAAPLPAAHGRGGRQVPRRTSGSRSPPRSACRCSRCARPRRRCSTPRSSPTAASSRSTTPSSGRSARSAGSTSSHACPTDAPAGPRPVGADTDEVRAEADAVDAGAPPPRAAGTARPRPRWRAIRVLDLGLAVAGPWGTMMLADLGADVIKVNPLHDGYWMSTHIAMCCNRGKRSIAINLKDPDGDGDPARAGRDGRRRAAQHALRRRRAPRRRLRVAADDQPDLIYCHTRGFEHGERERLPGNDQTGAALAGPDWLDGGLDHGGMPIWPVVSLGDTGNGFLSAIAIVQALYHRDRTGEGQFVDTSIMYAQLLNASIAWSRADGSGHGDRPQLDAMQLGWHALLPPLRDRPTAGCASPPIDDAQRGRAARRRLGVDAASPPTTDVRRARARVRATRSAGAVVRGASTPPACRARSRPPTSCSTSFDDPEMIETGLGHEVPATPSSARWRQSGCCSTSPRRPGVVQGPPLVPARTPAPSSASSATTTTASTSWPRPSTILDWRPANWRRVTCLGVIPPSPTSTTSSSGTAIAARAALFQRCAACGVLRHPPAPMCGECHSLEWDTQESSGHGHVYTWIVSHHPTKPDAEPRDRRAGRARRRHPLRVQPHRRRRRRRCDNGMAVALEHRRRSTSVVLPQFRPVGAAASRERAARRDTAIVGIGQTEFSKHSGRSELQLAAEAVAAAIARRRPHARPTSTAWSRSRWTPTTSSR